MLVIFGLDMIEEVLEQPRVVDNKLVKDGPVDVLTRELVLVTFLDDLGHLSEVSRNVGSVLSDDQVVMANYVLQKLSVILEVLQ
jgi:hypothetical protein